MDLELLSPAGSFEKLKTAFHFGADAVYLSGKQFGLRAFADNFTHEELAAAVSYAHAMGKKVYVTVNIFPYTEDFAELEDYLKYLAYIKADGAIVTDAGVISLAKRVAPTLELHLSTQANTTNAYSAAFWASQGVKRIVVARELSIDRIKAIRDILPSDVEIECFAHGAMCISYSGRCLLSNYLTGRDNNKGQCVQACRWNYVMHEVSRADRELEMQEDERGTYVMNSHDLKTITFIDELAKAGVKSFKIEGRMKTAYYVACTTDAYRRALDEVKAHPDDYHCKKEWDEELYLCSNRGFTEGFLHGGNGGIETVAPDNSQSSGGAEFIAVCLGYDYDKKCAIIEQRNRFKVGDKLELMSPSHESTVIEIKKIFDDEGNEIDDARRVQQRLLIPTDVVTTELDILRRRKS